jgi:hypothetical protein
MFRTLALASVASLFALTVGCSGSPDGTDNAANSTDDALSTKGGGYFVGTGPGLTGGVSVRLANAKTTACADGAKKSVCAVLGVDFGALKLGNAAATNLSDAFKAGHVVVKGRLDAKSGALVAEQAWLGAGTADAQDLDQLFQVTFHIQNEMCVKGADCSGPRYNQVAVNVTRNGEMIVNDVSLDGVGTKAQAAKGEDQMKIGGDGLLVLGHDVTLVSNHDAATTHTLLATNFFLPVSAGTATAAY